VSTAPADREVLSEDECGRLLASHHFGRIAFAHEGWPAVLPVNYVFDEPNVVIRTGTGAKSMSVPQTAVALEIDDADPAGSWGWSVLVQGPGFDVTDDGDTWSERLRALPLQPWAPGEKPRWLKISAVRISGRRFGRAD
jgi:nitroimidazol reductase NimA-like FMN-containing flavoprotein (pyridoxamine 5'-phosphate oxidase superfamily)